MSTRWIQLSLITALVLLLAACSGAQPAATATAVPPTAEESEPAAEAEAEPTATADDSSQEGEAESETEEEEGESSAAEIDAAAIFGARCARCHGADRVSGGAPDLVPDQLTKGSEAYLAIITNGSGPMPAFGGNLSAAEIEALVDFILSEPQ